jgi:methylmalonyl-CoA/ethylmalonyl-CoA epimerase
MTQPTPRGATIAHIGIAVRDLDAILPFYTNVLQMQDVSIEGENGVEGKRIAFIHPSSTAGVLVELSER